MMFNWEELFDDLKASPRTRSWCEELEKESLEAFQPDNNGNLARWQAAFHALGEFQVEQVSLSADAVTCKGEVNDSKELKKTLLQLKPWRKGPFQLFDIFIDTEWRSNLKWDRLSPHLELSDKDVLDVGCGNGYYGWRMLGAGARRVVGLDPYLLYVMQFAVLRRFFGEELRHYVLPVGDTIICPNLRLFDIVFSMGVLYHRRSPIEHLQSLGHALKLGGELVLETLIIEGENHEVLLPVDRYAQMKNVWFLPTLALLERMLERCGFSDVRVLDVSPTTVEEQRSTEWMTFESLPDFLDPKDHTKTVEGYPAPLRAVVKARKG